MNTRFCSHCGASVESQLVEGRRREVCSACGKVFYRNPLPVAAAVLLDPSRKVLLVRRKNEPYRGEWCLPMGFAEIGETIGEAALRELREEAGITGKVVRLLDSDSFHSDVYGELLIVTFEVEAPGAEARAGDDAEAAAWFSLDHLPHLPFSSNRKAVRACADAHRDDWAIQDSFRSMDPGPGDQELLSDALVALLHDHALDVVDLWMAEVRSSPTTTSYCRLSEKELRERGHFVVSQFGRWFKGNEADTEVREFYRALGRERRGQGFSLHELVSSLSLLKKHVFEFARSRSGGERPIDVYRAVELSRRIALFFDRALYHTAIGFETAS